MVGAVHNPNIPGGTRGHDYLTRVNGRNTMGYRRGGLFQRGGSTCPHGNYTTDAYGNQVCV